MARGLRSRRAYRAAFNGSVGKLEVLEGLL